MRRQPLSTPFLEPDDIPGVVRTSGFRPIGVDSAYSAFPSICQFSDRSLRLVWRQGTLHSLGTYDGVIKTSVSTDNGLTWATATTAVTGAAGTDLRDPCISTFSGVTHLTYFKANSSLAAAGAYYRQSSNDGASWGSEIRIDPSQPYAAISGPVYRLPNGDLITSYYGKNAGNTFDSCWSAKSTNNGTSWTRTLMADGQTAGRDYQEPWIIGSGTTVWAFFRYGTASAIGLSTSTDSGATWSAPVQLFTNATGRPSAAWLPNGTMVVVPRAIDNKQAILRSRKAGSANTAWAAPVPAGPWQSSGGIGMQYAHPLPIIGGTICALGVETNSSTSRIQIGWINEGAGTSPLGDTFWDEALSSAYEVDNILFSSTFRQVNGNLPSPWIVGAGAVTVTDGTLQSASNDNVVDLPRVYCGSNDMDVEADIYTSGPEAGYAVTFRVIDATNYLMFTVETQGTTWRLYKVVGGTATQLFSVAGALNFGVYHRYRVVARGNGIWCYVNDMFITPNVSAPSVPGTGYYSYQLSTPDMATFSAGMSAGLKLNAQTTTVHKCRRFVVKG